MGRTNADLAQPKCRTCRLLRCWRWSGSRTWRPATAPLSSATPDPATGARSSNEVVNWARHWSQRTGISTHRFPVSC